MQPTFLPWIGYFSMMERVDEFVFLDHVQFNKRSWQQRNVILGNQGTQWLTVPVTSKGKREQIIDDVAIDSTQGFPQKHLRSIKAQYSNAPFFKELFPHLEEIFLSNENLCQLNEKLIGAICKIIDIQTPTIRSIDLYNKKEISGTKDELICSICIARGADAYLSAPGSKEYLEANDLMGNKNIKIVYHAYNHPQYPQATSEFIPYLSIIDLIFNCGPNSLKILKSGVSTEKSI